MASADLKPSTLWAGGRFTLSVLREVAKMEAGAEWTDLDELRERHNLLAEIARMEAGAEWTDLDELQERANLLHEIEKKQRT